MLNYHIRKISLKNNETRYRSIITNSGKAITTKTFRKKSDARLFGNRLVIEYQGFEANGLTLCTVAFTQLADEYMHAWTGKDHDRVRLVVWWTKQLDNILLSKITSELIEEKLKVHETKAPATYNKYLAVSASMLKFALNKKYINSNPCKEIKSFKIDNEIRRFLSEDEKTRLIKSAKDIGGKFYLKVAMALTTGMRKGELEKLRWKDIDFDSGIASLSDTKNGEPRCVTIPATTMPLVKKHRGVGNMLLFPSSVNPDKAFDYKKQWANCLKDANIQNFRWHDMRHDFASRLARDGRSMLEIKKALGHKKVVSSERYAHIDTQHISGIINNSMNSHYSL